MAYNIMRYKFSQEIQSAISKRHEQAMYVRCFFCYNIVIFVYAIIPHFDDRYVSISNF